MEMLGVDAGCQDSTPSTGSPHFSPSRTHISLLAQVQAENPRLQLQRLHTYNTHTPCTAALGESIDTGHCIGQMRDLPGPEGIYVAFVDRRLLCVLSHFPRAQSDARELSRPRRPQCEGNACGWIQCDAVRYKQIRTEWTTDIVGISGSLYFRPFILGTRGSQRLVTLSIPSTILKGLMN